MQGWPQIMIMESKQAMHYICFLLSGYVYSSGGIYIYSNGGLNFGKLADAN